MQIFATYIRGRKVWTGFIVGMKDIEELHEKQN
jgi:hypothetical protein